MANYAEVIYCKDCDFFWAPPDDSFSVCRLNRYDNIFRRVQAFDFCSYAQQGKYNLGHYKDAKDGQMVKEDY